MEESIGRGERKHVRREDALMPREALPKMLGKVELLADEVGTGLLAGAGGNVVCWEREERDCWQRDRERARARLRVALPFFTPSHHPAPNPARADLSFRSGSSATMLSKDAPLHRLPLQCLITNFIPA
eukprot:3453919-Pleurochrysis_carterae.AAC.1